MSRIDGCVSFAELSTLVREECVDKGAEDAVFVARAGPDADQHHGMVEPFVLAMTAGPITDTPLGGLLPGVIRKPSSSPFWSPACSPRL